MIGPKTLTRPVREIGGEQNGDRNDADRQDGCLTRCGYLDPLDRRHRNCRCDDTVAEEQAGADTDSVSACRMLVPTETRCASAISARIPPSPGYRPAGSAGHI